MWSWIARAMIGLSIALASCGDKQATEAGGGEGKVEPVAPSGKFTCTAAPVAIAGGEPKGEGAVGARQCSGPGSRPDACKTSDCVEMDEVHCYRRRKSYADRESESVCAPSEEECKRLRSAPRSGSTTLLNRSECTPLEVADWKPSYPWQGTADGFECTTGLDRCYPMPGDIATSTALLPQAWCQGDGLVCYKTESACKASPLAMLGKRCTLQGPEVGLRSFEKVMGGASPGRR
jgi:hypothetical protein